MPQLYMIIPVGGLDGNRPDNSLPGQGGHPSQPIHHPGHPDHGLPSQPGHPSQPIFHPGHPDHGLPARPDQGLPGGSGGSPSHPIHIPGIPDQGLPEGEEIPSNELPPIPVPPEHADDLIVGVRQPNSDTWTFTAYDVQPDQGQPAPTPQSKSRRK